MRSPLEPVNIRTGVFPRNCHSNPCSNNRLGVAHCLHNRVCRTQTMRISVGACPERCRSSRSRKMKSVGLIMFSASVIAFQLVGSMALAEDSKTVDRRQYEQVVAKA